MTIIEAINHLDQVKPNGIDQDVKIKWLSELDGTIKREIIDTHEGSDSIPYEGYTPDTLLTTELLAPAPHDAVYVHYLEMKIDYLNGEYKKYNNSSEMFNAAYSDFAKYYNRTHMPKGAHFKYF